MLNFKKGIFNLSLVEILFFGVIAHTLAYNVIHPINKGLGHITALIGIVMCLYFYSFNFFTSIHVRKNVKPVYVILIIYSLIVISRGFISNSLDQKGLITTILSNNRGVIGYLTPLILLYTPKLKDLKTIFKISYICSWLAIGFVLFHFTDIFLMSHSLEILKEDDTINSNSMGQIAGYFALPASLILLFTQFLPKKYVRVASVAFVLSLLTSISFARRSYIAFHLIILIFVGFAFLRSNKVEKWKKSVMIIGILIFIASIPMLFSELTIFNLLSERLDSDTRSGVEMEFYNSFKGKPIDWIFGRGVFGTYYSEIAPSGTENRMYMETGYLQFILNGGLTMLILYVSILISAAYKGFFKSNNTLCKIFALFILSNIIFLKSGNSIEASIKGVMIWFMVAICNSKQWRLLLTDWHLIRLKQYLK